MLGFAPVRFRDDSPRCLILYRAAEGEPGKRSLLGSLCKIEVLGRGQQFVGYGSHPGGRPFQWHPADPALFSRNTLPPVTEAQIDAFFRGAARLIGADVPNPVDKSPAPIALIHTHETGCQTPSEREYAYAIKALADEVAKLAAVPTGGSRNQALNVAAFRMGKMIGAGWIELRTVEDALGKRLGPMAIEARMATLPLGPPCNRASRRV